MDFGQERKQVKNVDGGQEPKGDKRPMCKYGAGCYRKNPEHLKEFRHPGESPGDKEPEAKRAKMDVDDEEMMLAAKEVEEGTAGSTGEESKDKEESKSSSSDDSDSSAESEEEELPPSPVNIRESVKQKFLFEMPSDFYSFWDLCKSLNRDKPEDALLKTAGLKLVGPFDVLSGKLKGFKPRLQSAYLRHWRYYYDPPEFQTVIKGDDKSELHFGYFRDEPDEPPVFVGVNRAKEGCKIVPQGDNLFAAVSLHLRSMIKTADPFAKTPLQRLLQELENWSKGKKFSLEAKSERMKARGKRVVTPGFHGCGIVVPYNKKTQLGYRELFLDYDSLKDLLHKISDPKRREELKKKPREDLQEMITAVHIANDEGDPGTGLELGLALLAFGGEEFHKPLKLILNVAYQLLQRNEFTQVLQAHLADRKKGVGISMV